MVRNLEGVPYFFPDFIKEIELAIPLAMIISFSNSLLQDDKNLFQNHILIDVVPFVD